MFDELIQTANEPSQSSESPDQVHSELTFQEQHAMYMGAVETRILDLKTDPDIDFDEMDLRASTAIRLGWLQQRVACVIGAGGIGNWVWRVLAGMGIEKLIIIDDDVVEIQNVGPQFHNIVDLGRPKVAAVRDIMLAFRGVEIKTVQDRVTSWRHLMELCGCSPDILITAVDNMDLRNSLNGALRACIADRVTSVLPELYVDLRMSLGDWTAYTIPAKALAGHSRSLSLYDSGFYQAGAVFSQDSSVQEPCTARAIVYTGANIASYVGALVHWYTNVGRHVFGMGTEELPDPRLNMERFMLPNADWPFEFSVVTTFSAMDWQPITYTTAMRSLNARLNRSSGLIDALEEEVSELQARNDELRQTIDALRAGAEERDATPAPAPAPAPAPEPEAPRGIAFTDVDTGYVLVFQDGLKLYVSEISATYLTGVNLENGTTERATARVLNGVTEWYPEYSAYRASSLYSIDEWQFGDPLRNHPPQRGQVNIDDLLAAVGAPDFAVEEEEEEEEGGTPAQDLQTWTDDYLVRREMAGNPAEATQVLRSVGATENLSSGPGVTGALRRRWANAEENPNGTNVPF